MAQVADVLGDVDGPPVLDRLLALCLDMLSVTGAGLAVIRDGQHRGAVAVSDRLSGAVDDLQFTLSEGPCLRPTDPLAQCWNRTWSSQSHRDPRSPRPRSERA